MLLTSFAGNPHGFSAKVTDFGLARPQDVRVRSAPGRYGTVTHMAPETIQDGVLDYACDAYAFGVLCWEMITGACAMHSLVLLLLLFASECLLLPLCLGNKLGPCPCARGSMLGPCLICCWACACLMPPPPPSATAHGRGAVKRSCAGVVELVI